MRMALFDTPMHDMSGLKALTRDDEQRCLERFDLLPEAPQVITP